MTPTQGEHAQTEALLCAELLESVATNADMGRKPQASDYRRRAAAELRRLHAQVAALTAARPVAPATIPRAYSGRERGAYEAGWDDGFDHGKRTATPAQPAAPQGVAYAPYKQALGSKNCMQCCVSYMLGLPLESVPDFATDGGWELFSEFVEAKGYAAVMLPGNREFEADYLASGVTERGTSHMVVMNDGKLVHDPHPSNAGLVDVQCVWLLAKRASPASRRQDEHAAFESSAKAYTSNVSFARDGDDYEDMTASLLWHGWKLRASNGQAPAGAAHEKVDPWGHAIAQEERACRAEDALIDLVNQIRKTSPVDDHGHLLTMNMAYIKSVQLLDSAASTPTAQAAESVPAVDEFQPCPSCFGKGVDGDTDDYGRTIDVTCGECEGSGRAKVKEATEPKNAPSRYRDKCTLGGRCLGGCLVTEPCYHAARAPADSVLEDAAQLAKITQAIRDYHFALDNREHGGVAMARAWNAICDVLNMDWVQGAESAAREQGDKHD